MPPVSTAQRRAMYAAAAGKSNIGIPAKVGKEFVAADKPGKLPARAKGNEEKGESRKDNERRESNHYAPLSSMSRRGGY